MIAENLNQLKTFATPIFEMGKKIHAKIHRNQRSLDQNAWYWKCMKVISDYTGHTDKEIHAYCKNEYLASQVVRIFGKQIEDKPTTTTLNTKEFSEYMEKVIVFSHTELGCILPDPADYNLKRIAEFYKEQINR